MELVFLVDEFAVVGGATGLRVGVADLDGGFEPTGVTDGLLAGVEDRDLVFDGVEDLG